MTPDQYRQRSYHMTPRQRADWFISMKKQMQKAGYRHFRMGVHPDRENLICIEGWINKAPMDQPGPDWQFNEDGSPMDI